MGRMPREARRGPSRVALRRGDTPVVCDVPAEATSRRASTTVPTASSGSVTASGRWRSRTWATPDRVPLSKRRHAWLVDWSRELPAARLRGDTPERRRHALYLDRGVRSGRPALGSCTPRRGGCGPHRRGTGIDHSVATVLEHVPRDGRRRAHDHGGDAALSSRGVAPMRTSGPAMARRRSTRHGNRSPRPATTAALCSAVAAHPGVESGPHASRTSARAGHATNTIDCAA